MKKVKTGSILHLVLSIICYSVCAMIVWPLMELLIWCPINGTKFVYTVKDFVIEPLIFGVILGTIMWILDVIKLKKNK